MNDDVREEPTLENNLVCAISDWYGPSPIVVTEVLNALVGTLASIAFRAGCNTAEKRAELVNHVDQHVSSALEFYAGLDQEIRKK